VVSEKIFEKSTNQKALLEYPSLISKSKLMLKTNKVTFLPSPLLFFPVVLEKKSEM
jgi:hypothetical protein